ncbi:MAG: GDP-mannose 4,6-dehydratase [Myxococcales bacterium]|nr:GDP-mannose 4,6-dehydratase [Myxococcales bacterium]
MSVPQRVLVTGAAGFIGSHVTDRLLGEGRSVVGVDSFDPFYPASMKRRNLAGALSSARFELVESDIRDREAMQALFARGGFDGVVHLAALAGVRPSLERPADYADVNVRGSAQLFEAAVRYGLPRLVFASSSSVYGEREDGPFRESDPVERPISPYAATKRAGELLAHSFHHAHGLPVICARIFTAYGPRQRPDLAIRKFAERMLAGEPLSIYGDGSSLRDFTFISDLVDGLVAALDSDLDFSLLNLGAGHRLSVLEVVKTLEHELRVPAVLDYLPAQTGDVRRTWADITAAREALGYAPRVNFQEGVRLFVSWLRAER